MAFQMNWKGWTTVDITSNAALTTFILQSFANFEKQLTKLQRSDGSAPQALWAFLRDEAVIELVLFDLPEETPASRVPCYPQITVETPKLKKFTKLFYQAIVKKQP